MSRLGRDSCRSVQMSVYTDGGLYRCTSVQTDIGPREKGCAGAAPLSEDAGPTRRSWHKERVSVNWEELSTRA